MGLAVATACLADLSDTVPSASWPPSFGHWRPTSQGACPVGDLPPGLHPCLRCKRPASRMTDPVAVPAGRFADLSDTVSLTSRPPSLGLRCTALQATCLMGSLPFGLPPGLPIGPPPGPPPSLPPGCLLVRLLARLLTSLPARLPTHLTACLPRRRPVSLAFSHASGLSRRGLLCRGPGPPPSPRPAPTGVSATVPSASWSPSFGFWWPTS